jgi:mono/diheme cytochrome c family protein
VVSSGHVAVVSDPDRDQMVIVDLDTVKVRIQVALQKGDEPGRIVEDGVGHVHVVLRGAGALITIEPSTGLLLERRSVCTHPRGLAYDGANDSLHLACAGGQLVSLPAAGGAPTRQLALDADLRDVVVDGSRLLVSRFRSAELLVVEADGSVSGHLAPPSVTLLPPTPTGGSLNADGNAFSPAVAWRTTGAPGGGALMVFQEEQTSPVVPSTGGYGSRCGSVVRTGVCVLRADGTGWTVVSLPAILPIDVVATPAGLVELISASTSKSPAGLNVSSIIGFTPPTSSNPVDTGPCARSTAVTSPALTIQPDSVQASGGQVVAIAYDGQGRRLIQTRDPYLLFVGTTPVTLPGQSQKDTGHELFHLGTLGGLACASCHPEGRDDGHVWTFAGIGPRRTQSIRGGILGTEPFHWNGDMTNFDVLAHEVFGNRMSGPSLTTAYIQTLAGFIDQLPAMKPEPVLDSASVDRGRAIFQDPTVACATCHAGSKMTNNATVDVGTGGPFQVPSLVGVAWRAPYLHSGCASTLEARFGDCGGGELHGHTSQLIPSGRADLVAYLRSL